MTYVVPRTGRRPAQAVAFAVKRALTVEDISTLWGDRAASGHARVKALRYHHHLLAKAVASGKGTMECATLLGMSIGRVSDIKQDPAFQELVSYYAEELHEVYADVHKRMAALGTSVLEELTDRFESNPNGFTKRELMELFTTMADRSIPTAKGGPAAQSAAPGGGAGIALQVNFVGAPAQHAQHAEGKTPIEVEAVAVEVEAIEILSPAPPPLPVFAEPGPAEPTSAPAPLTAPEAREVFDAEWQRRKLLEILDVK